MGIFIGDYQLWIIAPDWHGNSNIMNRLESRFESSCELVFICIAIALLPVWFPCLVAWVLFDPFYRLRLFKKWIRSRGS